MEMRERHFLGLDLGQKQDYTAIAVLEKSEVQTGFDYAKWGPVMETRYNLRHLERVALGTPYTEVAERVRDVWDRAGRCPVAADATGVGAPVMDLLRESGLGCELIPVTITGGMGETRGGGTWRVPKRDLVVGLQVLLEKGRLRIAAGMMEGETLVKELREMRVKVSTAGHEGYEAWRDGAHDDLVLAVALACWRALWRDVGHVGLPLGVE